MSEYRPPQIKAHHLLRRAVVYVRQSTPKQVEEHTGSTAHQRGQQDYARRWGWPESAIDIIETDLGMSGTTGDRREGFQQLRKLVAQDQVGIILVSDTSRLTRSNLDFETLLELCRDTGTLLAVDGVIVDLEDPGNRLLARLRAGVAEYENELRTQSLMKAKRTKVQQGYAVTGPPTGYIVTQKGKWAKDPDMAVRQAIEEVFRQYEALGTAGKVLQFFAGNGVKLPIRRGSGEVHWVRPTRVRVYYILTNPAFAGYYVYGRRPHVRGAPRDVRRRTDWSDWTIVPDHHEAYVSPGKWRRISERLRSNRVTVRQPAGTGPALCQGLLHCGRCGRRMKTQYYRTPRRRIGITYSCDRAHVEYGEPKCWSVHGPSLDARVAEELLRCLDPPEIEAALEAAAEVNQGYEAARRQREAELEQARYDAKLVGKRYNLVDPAHRRLAATLEQEYERALERLERLERRHMEQPLEPPLVVTPEVVEAIQSLSSDLPSLWRAPSTSYQDRKTLVRLFVREILVVSVSETGFEVEIAWVGGAIARHAIVHPYAGGVIARQLAAQGLNYAQIAEELNRRGFTTLEHRTPYTAAGVKSLLQAAARRARIAATKRAEIAPGGVDSPPMTTYGTGIVRNKKFLSHVGDRKGQRLK